MSWVDAIVYALIMVYFVFAFIGQNYQIPSSSLQNRICLDRRVNLSQSAGHDLLAYETRQGVDVGILVA